MLASKIEQQIDGKFMVIALNVGYIAFFIAAQKATQKVQIGIWAPVLDLQIDLKSMTVEELQALHVRITEEHLNRSKID